MPTHCVLKSFAMETVKITARESCQRLSRQASVRSVCEITCIYSIACSLNARAILTPESCPQTTFPCKCEALSSRRGTPISAFPSHSYRKATPHMAHPHPFPPSFLLVAPFPFLPLSVLRWGSDHLPDLRYRRVDRIEGQPRSKVGVSRRVNGGLELSAAAAATPFWHRPRSTGLMLLNRPQSLT